MGKAGPDTHSAVLAYRADLDGLRAVAVLAVIAYHAWPGAVGGGFVGVDVFFVSSGFLITSLMLTALADHNFSVAAFYARRVKRIFPALAVVLVTSYCVGWRVLFDDELRQLGRHMAAGAGSVANLVLWSEAGYFDNASETKPLLHLWSLGIEEQFYLIWPWLVMWSVGRRGRFASLTAVLLAASLASNLLLIAEFPVATFYSPLTRLWELLSGAALSSWTLRCAAGRDAQTSRLHDALAALGLAMAIGSALLVNAFDAFPGPSTVVYLLCRHCAG